MVSRAVEDQDELGGVLEPLAEGNDVLVPSNATQQVDLQRDSLSVVSNVDLCPFWHALLQDVLDRDVLTSQLGFAAVN